MSVGNFKPESGTPFEAAEAFGPPSSVTRDDELCRQDWLDLGLVINFANLGGLDPCSEDGRVGSIELSGSLAEQAGWETAEGLKVGMGVQRLRSIYPDAKVESFPGLRDVYVLIEGPSVKPTPAAQIS
jgi:hypothetical protein